ncbi:MAG: response regulator [Planctomycetota bacterium]|nr:MAG: response regulator [Planctomycetota bacterium]RLS91385.1 MAG: response regulator [Planctomycetota bacterium]
MNPPSALLGLPQIRWTPSTSELELARRFRTVPVLDCPTAKVLRKSGFAGPMVALSALAHEATRQHSAASGFAEHLSKPTDGAQLQRVIAKLIAQHRCAK